MARKKKHEEHENHERWLVSYADFITLLFAFFVVMYSVSSVNEGKFRVLSESMVASFKSSQKSLMPIQIGASTKSPAPPRVEFRKTPKIKDSPKVLTPSPSSEDKNAGKGRGKGEGEGKKSMQQIAGDVEDSMSHLIQQELIAVKRGENWIEIEIKNSVLFAVGSAQFVSKANSVLIELGEILGKFSNPMRVEGYTDDVPINNLVYPSNWELSTARATSVVRTFIQAGIDPLRMAALGYGEYRPIAENSTPEGRAKNRRVVIVVLANKEAEQRLYDKLIDLESGDVKKEFSGEAGPAHPVEVLADDFNDNEQPISVRKIPVLNSAGVSQRSSEPNNFGNDNLESIERNTSAHHSGNKEASVRKEPLRRNIFENDDHSAKTSPRERTRDKLKQNTTTSPRHSESSQFRPITLPFDKH